MFYGPALWPCWFGNLTQSPLVKWWWQSCMPNLHEGLAACPSCQVPRRGAGTSIFGIWVYRRGIIFLDISLAQWYHDFLCHKDNTKYFVMFEHIVVYIRRRLSHSQSMYQKLWQIDGQCTCQNGCQWVYVSVRMSAPLLHAMLVEFKVY